MKSRGWPASIAFCIAAIDSRTRCSSGVRWQAATSARIVQIAANRTIRESCTVRAKIAMQLAGVSPRMLKSANHLGSGMSDIERPWLASYPPGVPARIDVDEYRSIAHALEAACERFSHRPAFENMGKVLTYADVDRLSRQFASYLLNELKLQRGDRVAIMLPNVLQYPIAIFGVLRAGLTGVNT